MTTGLPFPLEAAQLYPTVTIGIVSSIFFYFALAAFEATSASKVMAPFIKAASGVDSVAKASLS